MAKYHFENVENVLEIKEGDKISVSFTMEERQLTEPEKKEFRDLYRLGHHKFSYFVNKYEVSLQQLVNIWDE